MIATTKKFIFAGACALSLTAPAVLRAQAFPSDKISVVVPYSPGNGLDQLGREFAEILQTQMSVPVIVENREGAAGVIGTQYTMRAQANGYTVLFTANPPFVTSPYTLEKSPYDPVGSFVPVARVGSVPLVLVTASKWQIKNVEQLKEFVKRDPKAASYASAGAGSPGHIYGELLNQAAGLNLQEIRYKATGQALTDVISGNVLVSLVSVPAAAQHLKAGTLTALGMGSSQRLAGYKDVPTLAEALGHKEFEAGVWYGFLAPAGTPPERIEKLYAEVAKAAESSRMRAFMERQSMVPELLKPVDFGRSLRQDVATSRKLLTDSKINAR